MFTDDDLLQPMMCKDNISQDHVHKQNSRTDQKMN